MVYLTESEVTETEVEMPASSDLLQYNNYETARTLNWQYVNENSQKKKKKPNKT